MRKKLLEVLTKKDRTDCISQVLEEHLKFALPYEKTWMQIFFVPYVLNPRVDDEVLQKYRKAILEQLSEEEKNMLQKEPAKIWKWIEDKIISSPEKRTQQCDHHAVRMSENGNRKPSVKKILLWQWREHWEFQHA